VRIIFGLLPVPLLTPQILESEAPKIVGRKPDFGSSRRLIFRAARLLRAEDYSSPGWMRPDSYASTTACTRSRRSLSLIPL
jgi:hypothetical protein